MNKVLSRGIESRISLYYTYFVYETHLVHFISIDYTGEKGIYCTSYITVSIPQYLFLTIPNPFKEDYFVTEPPSRWLS